MARENKIPTIKIEIGKNSTVEHKSGKTIEIYIHMNKDSLTSIKNPPDSIFKEEQTWLHPDPKTGKNIRIADMNELSEISRVGGKGNA